MWHVLCVLCAMSQHVVGLHVFEKLLKVFCGACYSGALHRRGFQEAAQDGPELVPPPALLFAPVQ